VTRLVEFLGLRIQPPDASIGTMISVAMPYPDSNTWQVAIPSATLMTIVPAMSFLGDGLRDAFAGENQTRQTTANRSARRSGADVSSTSSRLRTKGRPFGRQGLISRTTSPPTRSGGFAR
jgi:hypothetical protein